MNDQTLTSQGFYSAREREKFLYSILFQRVFDPFARYRVICDENVNNCDVEFLDVNPAYERVMGVNREDVIGKRFREVWPDAEDRWMDIIVKSIRTGGSSRVEGYSHDTDKYLEAMAFPTFPGEVAVIFLDRTKWKRSDEKLRKSEQTLLEYRKELRELATKLSLAEAEARRKIANRIHDTIGYSLVEILNEIRNMSMINDNPTLKESLYNLTQMTEKVISDSRDLTFETASPLLYEVGLNAAIEELADNILTPYEIGFDFHGSNRHYDAPIRICVLLFQMTRELLVNVVKHAEATFIKLRVHRSPSKIRVIVEDNGKGFPPSFNSKWGQLKGFGLFSIRERLLPIGGNIQIYSEPDKGATIILEAPLKEKEFLEATK